MLKKFICWYFVIYLIDLIFCCILIKDGKIMFIFVFFMVFIFGYDVIIVVNDGYIIVGGKLWSVYVKGIF